MRCLNRLEGWRRRPEHPWQWIDCYRALLLWEAGRDDASADCFEAAVGLCEVAQSGATIKLLGAVIACIAAACLQDSGFNERAEELARGLDALLPGAAHQLEVVRRAGPCDPYARIDELLRSLPFNYR